MSGKRISKWPPLTSLTRIIMPSLSGFILCYYALFISYHAGDLAAAAKKLRRPMIDGIGNYATNSRTYLPNAGLPGLVYVSRLYTHVARKPVAGFKGARVSSA